MKDQESQLPDADEPTASAVRALARAAIPDADLQTVLGRVARDLRAMSGCEAVCCVTFGEGPGELVLKAISCAGAPDREIGDAIDGERALILRDTIERGEAVVERKDEESWELFFPVRTGPAESALLHVRDADRSRVESLIPILDVVSGQIACAVAGARLFEEARWQARTMEMMREVARAVLEVDSLTDVLKQITDFVVERFGMALADVLLLDETRSRFDVAAYSGNVALIRPKGTEWPITSGVCGRCARTGEPQLVIDVESDPDYYPADPAIRSEFCIPLFYRGEVIGVMNAESAEADAFSPGQRDTLRAIAEQVSGAIHMAHLNQRLSESNREVEETTVELEDANRKLALANRELETLSTHDALTMVPNRRRFDQVLDTEWRRSRRSGKPVSLLFVDIDHFKALNDTYGHREGDECLRRVAHTLQDGLRRAGDFIARYGGEEFALILPDTEAKRALAHAEKLRKAVEALAIPNEGSPGGGNLTISVGVATWCPAEEMLVEDLVHQADAALYEAKRGGRNRVAVFRRDSKTSATNPDE